MNKLYINGDDDPSVGQLTKMNNIFFSLCKPSCPMFDLMFMCVAYIGFHALASYEPTSCEMKAAMDCRRGSRAVGSGGRERTRVEVPHDGPLFAEADKHARVCASLLQRPNC